MSTSERIDLTVNIAIPGQGCDARLIATATKVNAEPHSAAHPRPPALTLFVQKKADFRSRASFQSGPEV